MKIVKDEAKKTRGVTLRISEEIMSRIDEAAEKNGISRQRLIEAILEQVLSDKNFVLHLKG